MVEGPFVCWPEPKHGYFPKLSKTILIIKSKYDSKAAEIFDTTNIKVTSSDQRHLGAVIRSEPHRKDYIEEIVTKWRDELFLLSKIVEIQPQAAYSAHIHGFKRK